MGGGSMDYLFMKIGEAAFEESTPHRKALRKHLDKLAVVLHCVEWNDSGDGTPAELLKAGLTENDVIDDLLGQCIEDPEPPRLRSLSEFFMLWD